MSVDRIVRFPKRKPTAAEVESILRNYLGGAVAELLRWESPDKSAVDFGVVMYSPSSFPFAGIAPRIPNPHINRERRIEVFAVLEGKGSAYISVTTRQADEFTGSVADGLAKLMARFYEGQLEGER